MIMPYLSFNGNCEKAFVWYAQIFNGKIQHMAKYGDILANPKSKVMHAELLLTDHGGISGADVLSPTEVGSAIFIHAHLSDESDAKRVFAALSDGGTVLGELATNPPPDDSGISGCVKDKYGFTWIISAMKSV